MRSAAPSDPLAALIRKRVLDLQSRTPTILVPASFSATGFGVVPYDNFLGLGVPLYIDSIAMQIRAPIFTEQAATTGPAGVWSSTSSNAVVELQLVQPKGQVDGLNPGFRFISIMRIPTYERDIILQTVQADGNPVDPGLPLLGNVRVVWPNRASQVPPEVSVDVTVLFAVTAIPRAKA